MIEIEAGANSGQETVSLNLLGHVVSLLGR